MKNQNLQSRSQISNSTAVGTVVGTTFAARSGTKKRTDDDGNTEADMFDREGESEK